jgi:hypothetical protein
VEDPEQLIDAEPPSDRAALLVLQGDSGRRNRLGVFFRVILALPHLIWLTLWGIATVLIVIVAWVATLATGRLPGALHRLLGAFVRYSTAVLSYLYLLAERYPPFIPRPVPYPVDVVLAPPLPQNRWRTLGRLILVFPAWMLAAAYSGVLATVAFLGWFAALVLGRMPHGLRNLGLACMNYTAQTYAYLLLLTEQYPYSGPAPSWAELAPAAAAADPAPS